LKPRVRRKHVGRLAPKSKRKLGAELTPWDRIRLLIRRWQIWAGLAVFLFVSGGRVLGLAATVIAVFFYLASPLFHPAAYAIETKLVPGSREFRLTMGGITGSPIFGGNKLEILNNGDEFYPRMLHEIAQARESITMEQYIYWDSDIGLRFAEAFAERAAAGVPVKLLVDAIGSSNIGERILKTLEQSGCELAWFRPIKWYTLNRANFRTHRKSVIVDGRVAFTGGAGIAEHWCGGATCPEEWREMQVCVTGPAAIVLQSGFAQNWLVATGEMITGEHFFPEHENRGDVAIQTILSSPNAGAGAAGSMYLLALQCAQESIYIANPYFIPSRQVIAILSHLSKRGVDIRLMLSGEHCDTWWARQNSIRLYGDLMQAGVRIYEYEPTMLHQKYMAIDRRWATIGTTNFDNRSFALNEETNVCFHDPAHVEHLCRIFFNDLRHCREIDRNSWTKRGVQQRGREFFASLLEDQV
jgi:cardiolipin synthase